ncbi:RagB/SusD family nutrient uptake outer membrane protein [Marinifilum caeruleilacunae]|uniref:RagB/SusD family nutrient uptake outer membrane protein n=1 Tax=Marinifilum caeruleilacunae TaxID=2499076 RepID=A0ABX1WRG6_9BACT|nr:RagB/SusD family nutrient uptake outer membrane protein [Marinifilum caeruleilacunae]NOU58667.1 RagB/SusD family nutrient uptake outer membrane protein [Marinifilum caeruleilacunae]
MKKLIYIGLLALGFASCSDFLDIDDETKISNDRLFSTLSGVEEALNGAYYEMGATNYYGTQMIMAAEVKGGNLKIDDLNFESPFSFYYIPAFEFTHTVEGEDDYFDGCYGQIYEVISAANMVIENIDYVEDASDLQKLQAVAEAKAIRALAHFDLARLYAQPYSYTANAQHLGIPYLQKNIAYHELTSRDLLYDNYENIIADLLEAEQNLGTAIGVEEAKSAKFYMSKVAAQALLARVYLYKSDWDKAREYATKVIESGSASLLPNSEVLDYYSNNTPTNEDLFAIDNGGRNNAAPLSDRIGISENRDRFYLLPSNDIIDLYDDEDVRKQLFGEQEAKDVVQSLTAKWTEMADKDHYIPVVRLAEMYLIRAEASLNLPAIDEVQARADLDVIRKRANPNATNLQLSGAALKEELFLERRRELAFEGHLFFDIVRMGRDLRRVDCNATQNVNVDYPSDLFVLPIPEDAIEGNPNMVQNPGY